MHAAAIRAVLTDIEGTTTPISFVHDVLFPYARTRIPALVEGASASPEVADAVARVRDLAPGRDPIEVLGEWQDTDAKVEPLKTLQGIAWRDGYRSGALTGIVYDDVPPALRRWHGSGLRLAVYSSGSVEAQKLIFGHAQAGDLAALFEDFFDTRVGPKRAAASYRLIAERLELAAPAILFLSDVAAELDAAREAGFATCQLLRPSDGAEAAPEHRKACDFDAVARAFDLPRPA